MTPIASQCVTSIKDCSYLLAKGTKVFAILCHFLFGPFPCTTMTSNLRKIWFETIHDHVWSRKEGKPQNNLDVVIQCRDGSISAHLLMLRFASKTIADAVDKVEDFPLLIMVPDFSKRTVSKGLELIYTGSVDLKSDFEIGQVMDFLCNRLAIDMMLDWSFDPLSRGTIKPPETPIMIFDVDEDQVEDEGLEPLITMHRPLLQSWQLQDQQHPKGHKPQWQHQQPNLGLEKQQLPKLQHDKQQQPNVQYDKQQQHNQCQQQLK